MLEIIYHDRWMVAINKPSGWLVHRSWLDRHEKTFIMQTLRDQLGQHVFTIHRLDRPTSGVLLFGLSSEIAHLLAQQFEQKKVVKTYHAIVRGWLEQSGTLDYPLIRQRDKIADKFSATENESQQAMTHYRPLAQTEVAVPVGRYDSARYTLTALQPETGRKHQLRRHMAHLRHPIIGDSRHGDLRQNRGAAHYFECQRLMLHASELRLRHPVTGESLLLRAGLDQTWTNMLQQFGWQGILPVESGVELSLIPGEDRTLTEERV